MLQSHKVLLNTFSLYIKIIANALVTLFATRIALSALGIESFGLYNLIAGIITLLSFFTGTLMVSSQRFLSIALGEKDNLKLKKIFNVSLFVHLILAIAVGGIFKIIQPLLFNGFLNINSNQVNDAIIVYDVMIISCIVTIFTIPYNAAINAREEMWFFSISEIIIIILKLLAAIVLLYINSDHLLIYTILMLNAILIGGIIKFLWCRKRYQECRLKLEYCKDKALFKEIFSFAGWNMLGSLAMVLRNQGVAVVLNIFFGTVVNAAYGVANQLNSLVITFASTLTTVFTPMITKAKGEKDEEKMVFISVFSSKLSFFLSSLIAIPVLTNTQLILSVWLKEVPINTVEFCKYIILTFLIMQIYPGLTRAIYATGKIKWYQIVMSIILILNIPLGYIFFKAGYPPVTILQTMLLAQIFTMISTIYFANKLMNIDIKDFFINSVVKPILIFVLIYKLNIFLNNMGLNNQYSNYIFITCISLIIYVIIYFLMVFNNKEKQLLINLKKSLNEKIIKKINR